MSARVRPTESLRMERKFNFNIFICICVYIYICIYVYVTCIFIVLSFPHTSLNHSLNTLKSIRPVISFPPPTSKIHAENPGQCNMGHWAQVVSPYQPTTIPKNCHKNTRCMSLAQSISIGLTSQQIIQLGQLCYPVGTQLFKHPWTDERSCKTSLHAVDICWWQSTFECIIQQTVTGDEIGQMFHAKTGISMFFCLWNRGSSMNKYPKHFVGPRFVDKKIWNKSTPLKNTHKF